MNPGSGETRAPFEMPAEPVEGSEQQHDKQMEKRGASESAAGKHQPPAASAPVMQLPVDIPDAAPVSIPSDDQQDDQHKADSLEAQGAAHDSHKIEKQWVERAKKVITQTKTDPHAQKQHVSVVKAEYIRKRFNKTIPTDGPAAV